MNWARKWWWAVALILISLTGEGIRTWAALKGLETETPIRDDNPIPEVSRPPFQEPERTLPQKALPTSTSAPSLIKAVAPPSANMQDFRAQTLKDYCAALRILYGPDYYPGAAATSPK